jgi:chorismate synthase
LINSRRSREGNASINAVKGFEYGSGFAGSEMLQQHNDYTQTVARNRIHSGGIQGGI